MEARRRYIMLISYIGSGFRGSQIQFEKGEIKDKTVQGVIEEGLNRIFGLTGERPIRVVICSRTDRGVHALKSVLSTDLPAYKNTFLSSEAVQQKLNRYFSQHEDIRVLEVFNVPKTFKIRPAVVDKTYLYRVGVLQKEFYNVEKKYLAPIMEINRTHLIRYNGDFDIVKAEEATCLFEGEKDFGAIVGKPSQNTRPTICNIKSFKVEKAQPLVPFDPLTEKYSFYHFICKGDRFLFHMVRRMVSLTISVGYSLLTLSDITKLFEQPVPSSWPRKGVQEVSGSGLYLTDTKLDVGKIMEASNEELLKKEEISLSKENSEETYN